MSANQERQNETSNLMRVPDVARFLNCSERTVWRLICAGLLNRIKIGRAVRLDKADVERFIQEGGQS
jgi:excisionase family DNA binding protein